VECGEALVSGPQQLPEVPQQVAHPPTYMMCSSDEQQSAALCQTPARFSMQLADWETHCDASIHVIDIIIDIPLG
jgi:hypothetical protein